MVLLAAIALIALMVGVVWLASYAWGRVGEGWPEPVSGSVPKWLLLVAMVFLFGVAVYLLRLRAMPALLLFIPIVWMMRKRTRCSTCGEAILADRDTCSACGSRRS